MVKPPVPLDEPQRLEELREYNVLDTPQEQGFDDLVTIASHVCNAPIALMSLIDTNRQFIKSRVGLDLLETSRDHAFCAHAINQPGLMIVPDAMADARFEDNPLVRSDPHIRFYAGAPLITPRGHAMGTLCVIDRVPRDLSESQQQALAALGRQIVALLQLRRAKDQAEQASEAKGRLLTQLQAEQERSERLLLSLFPKPIAERLKHESPAGIAEEYSDVTILFAEVMDFWKVAGSLPPPKFVGILNQVFSLFDRLADAHGVQKIRTISNAYLAVAGLPDPRPNHAEAVAELALDIQRELTDLRTGLSSPFSVRIGIHSGPVVAGVVGTRRLAYDLWGPAVNLASQMESCSMAGTIQVTSATYERLRDHYLFEPRGEFYIKGEGEVATYLLRGRRRPITG